MKKPISRLSVLLTIPLLLTACGKGMHMTVPAAIPAAQNNSTNSGQPTAVTVAKDGSSIMLGSGNPTDALGSPGDLYLNSTTDDLYQKGNGNPAWTLKGNLKGKDGTNGTNGSNASFFTGIAPPLAGSKLNGAYVNSSTGDLYILVPGSVPQLVMNLRGPQGTSVKGDSAQQFLNSPEAPTAKQGNLNDVYLDTVKGDLYRKTDASTWTLFYSIGTKSTDADNGSSNFSSGPAAPTTQTLAIGGVYLDLDTCTFYHRNADGSIQILFQKNSPVTSGHGDPSKVAANSGNPGDLFLDIDTSNLYQKLDGKWTFLMSLKGKDGLNTTTTVNVPAPPAPPAVLLSLGDAELNFAHGKSEVSDAAKIELIATAKALSGDLSGIKEIKIEGQADRSGSPEYNKSLALARAISVKNILTATGEVDSAKLMASGLEEPATSSCPGTNNCEKDRFVRIGIQLEDNLTLEKRNAIISQLNNDFQLIWKK